MKQETFSLRGQEYIQLDQLMKLLGWVESGSVAHEVIDEGMVKVDGETELRRRRKLREGMIVEFENYQIKIEL
ncbi:MAG: hypothetical protein A2W93_10490 [Bacteroidetes bacterium GWF2_43_63]|nr:MAG: hypothetical protein A2W94_01980 [Bacteroidetes bacterium GWE2_42_42]OFY53005.1 MAG: hypothetical protein A2W93_10490 [Bacteroidetes bacterium GWF2_43_63]HBG70156.1 RNA-binding protein [Bacteroidales bacterium]HCB62237.1 RNA-binding protein [Bacteroidales bacterium]